MNLVYVTKSTIIHLLLLHQSDYVLKVGVSVHSLVYLMYKATRKSVLLLVVLFFVSIITSSVCL